MEFISEALDAYCNLHTSDENPLLAQLNRETHAKILQPRMLSGHFQGRFLSLLMKLVQPKRILEIGTFTGYSALCLAEGLFENGKLTTIDINEEREGFTRSFFNQSEFKTQIEYLIGDAQLIIPTMNEHFDVIFIDADKKNYINYFDIVAEKVTKGGLIIADNVLWSGKVADTKQNDKETVLLRNFNKQVQNDDRFENILLPIRDGLMIARKK